MNRTAIGDDLDSLQEFWTIERFTACMENGGRIEYKVNEQVDLELSAVLAAEYIDHVSRYGSEFTVWCVKKKESVSVNFDPAKRDLKKGIDIN